MANCRPHDRKNKHGADDFQTKRLQVAYLKLYNQGTQVASPVKLENMRRSRATDASYHDGNARAKKPSPGRFNLKIKSWSPKIIMSSMFFQPQKSLNLNMFSSERVTWKPPAAQNQTGIPNLGEKTCNN